MNRGEFLKIVAAALAGTAVAPRIFGGNDDSAGTQNSLAGTINLAIFGLGGMGLADMKALSTLKNVKIVALCDPDERALKRALKRLADDVPAAEIPEIFIDYKTVFDHARERIDAAVVATPDHSHFDIAMEAVRHNKHLFVEKPICQNIAQLRVLAVAARERNLITQAGNQGAVSNLIRVAREWIEAGILGEITHIHAWTNRPIWPQGMDSEPAPGVCPPQFHWPIWLGNAKKRPFSKQIAHFNWRGWRDYGTGALGDMAQHVLNPAFFIFDLRKPKITKIETHGSTKLAFPRGEKIVFECVRGNGNPLEITWFDGDFVRGNADSGIGNGEFCVPAAAKNAIGGSIIFGTKNDLLIGSSGETIQLLRDFDKNELRKIRQKFPRIRGNIYRNWIDSLRAGTQPVANFDAMLPLTETVLLGVEASFPQG